MTTTASTTSPTPEALLNDASLVGDWMIDGTKSTVVLKTRHTWGLLPVSGVFHQVSGHGVLTADGSVQGTLTVTAASIDTDNTKRDEHLRSADFFDVSAYPDITFSLQQVRPDAAGIAIVGELTVRAKTLPVTTHGNVSLIDDELRLDVEIPINRADFGLTWNRIGMASLKNTIIVHAVFAKQSANTPTV